MTAPTPEMRTIGPLEQHAIDTAPFGGLAQHYYQLWLRGSDAIYGLERALAAERDRADRAEATIADALEWVGKVGGDGAAYEILSNYKATV